jgi:hypothetical protein
VADCFFGQHVEPHTTTPAGERAGEAGAHPAVASASSRLVDVLRDQALQFRGQLDDLHARAVEVGGFDELVEATARHRSEADKVIATLDAARHAITP